MRPAEAFLRRLIRENLLLEEKPYGDSFYAAYSHLSEIMVANLKFISDRNATYGDYVKLFEDEIPGFRYQDWGPYSPDKKLEVPASSDDRAFVREVSNRIFDFIAGDDRKDLNATRAVERIAKNIRREKRAHIKVLRQENENEYKREQEALAASWSPTAPEGSPLGKYAFSPQRQSTENRPPYEKNTPVESALLRSITNHFSGMRPLTRKQSDMMLGFIRDGLYSDILREPPPGTYFRGMLLPLEDLERMGVDVTDLEPDGRKQELSGNFEITPAGDRFSSSWTADIDVADKFSIGHLGQGAHDVYSVIFAADTNDNPGRFIDADGLYEIEMEDISDFAPEREIIGLGTIIANRVKLMRLA